MLLSEARRWFLLEFQDTHAFGTSGIPLDIAAQLAKCKDPQDSVFLELLKTLKQDGMIRVLRGKISLTKAALRRLPKVPPAADRLERLERLQRIVHVASPGHVTMAQSDAICRFLFDGQVRTVEEIALASGFANTSSAIFTAASLTLIKLGLVVKVGTKSLKMKAFVYSLNGT
jgi:hypothetical protein